MDGKYWDEMMAAERLMQYRAQQEHYMGISFTTISAFGSNGAIIHYQPVQETNKQITNTSLYLLDSGGQYKGKRLSREVSGERDASILQVSPTG